MLAQELTIGRHAAGVTDSRTPWQNSSFLEPAAVGNSALMTCSITNPEDLQITDLQKYSNNPLIRTLVVRLSNYPDQLGPFR